MPVTDNQDPMDTVNEAKRKIDEALKSYIGKMDVKDDIRNMRAGLNETVLSIKNMMCLTQRSEKVDKNDEENYSVFNIQFLRTYLMGIMTMTTCMLGVLDDIEAKIDMLLKENEK